jgi:hypothetical protein
MGKAVKAQILLQWADEDWRWHEERFSNVHALAIFLKQRKDVAYWVDYIPKKNRNSNRF